MNRLLGLMRTSFQIIRIQTPKHQIPALNSSTTPQIIHSQPNTRDTKLTRKPRKFDDHDPEITVTKLDNLIKKYNIDLGRLETLIKKIKKTIRPYCQYTQIKFGTFIEKNPNMSQQDLMKAVAAEWKSLTVDEKLIYFKLAKEENDRTFKEIEDLLKDVSFQEKIEIKMLINKVLYNERLQRRATQLKKARKLELLETGKPKRALNSWSEFISDQDRGDAGLVDFITGCKYKWSALTVQEKQYYEKRAKERSEQYQLDMSEWESKMLQAGRSDIVRIGTCKKFMRMTEGKQKLKSKMLDNYSENEEEKDDEKIKNN